MRSEEIVLNLSRFGPVCRRVGGRRRSAASSEAVVISRYVTRLPDDEAEGEEG